jgi:hypothetical protein
VSVGAHRDVHVGVPEPLAHDLDRHPRHADGDGGLRVAHVVQADGRHAYGGAVGAEPLRNVFG